MERQNGFKCPRCNFTSTLTGPETDRDHRTKSPSCFSSLESDAVVAVPRPGFRRVQTDYDAILVQTFQNSLSLQSRYVVRPTGRIESPDRETYERHHSDPLPSTSRTKTHLDTIRRSPNLVLPNEKGLLSAEQIEDAFRSLRCAICYVRWQNSVIRFCRHLSFCDVCLSRSYASGCGICRGEVKGSFPIRFHSMHLIEDIVTQISSGHEQDHSEMLVNMGYERSAVQRALRRLSPTATMNGIIDYFESSPNPDDPFESAYSFPTPEEIELVFLDPAGRREDKEKINEWLRVVRKCLVCQKGVPSICLMPCYHLAVCSECNESPNKPTHCPDIKCGQKIKNQVKIYFSLDDTSVPG